MSIIKFIFASLLLAVSFTASALSGWDRSVKQGGVVFTPSDLAKDKVFEYSFFGPIKLNTDDYRTWFRDTTLAMQKKLGKPEGTWEVKQDKDKWSVTTFYFDPSGSKLQSAFESGKLQNGHVYIMNLRSNVGLLALVKYGLAYENLLTEVESHFAEQPVIGMSTHTQIPSPTKTSTRSEQTQPKPQPETHPATTKKPSKLTGKERREAIEAAIRVAPGKGVKPGDIEAVWVYSNLDVIWGGMDVNTYLLLEDGTVYQRCKIPPNELNITASRELQPKQWSEWRRSWGKYEIKDRKTNQWKELRGAEAGVARKGTSLAGTYLNAGGSQYSGSWKKTITFHENGRFQLDSSVLRSNSGMGGGDTAPLVTVSSKSDKDGTSTATSVVGANVGGGSSAKKNDGSKNTGRYQINDYSITLIHDNGWEHTELLLYEKGDKENALIYDDRIYYYNDD